LFEMNDGTVYICIYIYMEMELYGVWARISHEIEREKGNYMR
jgi:hypothetical protein